MTAPAHIHWPPVGGRVAVIVAPDPLPSRFETVVSVNKTSVVTRRDGATARSDVERYYVAGIFAGQSHYGGDVRARPEEPGDEARVAAAPDRAKLREAEQTVRNEEMNVAALSSQIERQRADLAETENRLATKKVVLAQVQEEIARLQAKLGIATS